MEGLFLFMWLGCSYIFEALCMSVSKLSQSRPSVRRIFCKRLNGSNFFTHLFWEWYSI